MLSSDLRVLRGGLFRISDLRLRMAWSEHSRAAILAMSQVEVR